jgi:hypothetical protein
MSKENKSKQIQIFEEIRKDLTNKTENTLKVPMSYVFGRGSTGDIQSFGDKTFSQNALMVDQALENTQELEQIWNHSHTQWIWKHLNLCYHSPIRNMRQISAEISSKKTALNEAKWRHIKNEIKIRKIEEELEQENLDYWREVELKVKLAELKEGLVAGSTYIQGAMKDVLALNDLYEQLKVQIGDFSEEDVEKQETISHLKRSIVQCIRDVRQSGHITKGEQEYVERIGVNPSKLQMIIRKYVESEVNAEGWDVTPLHEFVDGLANELASVYKVDRTLMNLAGFTSEPNSNYSYTNKIKKLPQGDPPDSIE